MPLQSSTLPKGATLDQRASGSLTMLNCVGNIKVEVDAEYDEAGGGNAASSASGPVSLPMNLSSLQRKLSLRK